MIIQKIFCLSLYQIEDKMHIKEGQNREELVMLSYDMLVSPENPVRLIDLMCKRFISENPWRQEWKGTKDIGRKSYPPSVMMALLVYGYFNKINSSRRLETETHRNIEVIWLMEGHRPDHWTICSFRRENENLVKDLLKSFRLFLLEKGYASAKRIVIDGAKFKAYADRQMLTKDSVAKKIEKLDKSIAEYLGQLENNDIHDDELDSAREEIKTLQEKIEKLEKQKEKLKEINESLESSGKKYFAPNDTDAVLVKGRDGKFAGYNGQAAVEAKGHFIMQNELTTSPVDQDQLKNCVNKTQKEIEASIEEILADKGYGNTTHILEVEQEGIQCYIPLETTTREKEQTKGLVFTYDESTDSYTCPQGKKLMLFQKNHLSSGALYDRYKCYECEGCPIRNDCTQSKTGRTYKRNINQERIDKYKEKLKSDYAKERIRERKNIVEHPFGTIKWMMGKFNFLLTGQQKVQIEYDLYAMAYNLKRLINHEMPLSELMGQINDHKWART